MIESDDQPRWDAICLDEADNVATVLRPLAEGDRPTVAGTERESPVLNTSIPRGHKIALTAIGSGETVIKYGAPIGAATTDIRAGDHVHLHNLEGFAGREARRAQGRG